MPVSITHLVRDRRTVTVPVGDESLTVTYRPSGFTPETETKLREYADDQRGGAALVALLADCLVDWDLLDEAGKPLPINARVLSSLPTLFLVQVVRAINEDMRPNLTSAGASAAGSLPRDD